MGGLGGHADHLGEEGLGEGGLGEGDQVGEGLESPEDREVQEGDGGLLVG